MHKRILYQVTYVIYPHSFLSLSQSPRAYNPQAQVLHAFAVKACPYRAVLKVQICGQAHILHPMKCKGIYFYSIHYILFPWALALLLLFLLQIVLEMGDEHGVEVWENQHLEVQINMYHPFHLFTYLAAQGFFPWRARIMSWSGVPTWKVGPSGWNVNVKRTQPTARDMGSYFLFTCYSSAQLMMSRSMIVMITVGLVYIAASRRSVTILVVYLTNSLFSSQDCDRFPSKDWIVFEICMETRMPH